jgi:excisionase family DNA binding protein
MKRRAGNGKHRTRKRATAKPTVVKIYPIRLPDDMALKVARSAREARRSLREEVLYRLRRDYRVENAYSETDNSWYTVREAMAALRCGRSKLYQLFDRGQLKYQKFGGQTRIPREAIKNLIESLPSA